MMTQPPPPEAPPAHIPPQNREAEEAVLGSILIDPEAIYYVMDTLKADHFYSVSAGWIYQACLDLHRQGEPIDIITLSRELRARNQLEDVGGESYIISLVTAVPTSLNAWTYANIVYEAHRRREIIKAAGEMATAAFDEERELSDVVSECQSLAMSAFTEATSGRQAVKAGEVGLDLVARMEAAQRGEYAPSISLPWRAFANMPIIHGSFVALYARPGMGKTSALLQILRHAANFGMTAVLFSLEMTRNQIVARMVMQATGIDEKRIMGIKGVPPLDDNEMGIVYREIDRINSLPFIIYDMSSLRIDDMQAECRKLALKYGNELVLGVDYLQYMDGSGRKGANKYEDVTTISKGLKSIAKDCGYVFALVQLSRAVENRGEKRPMQSDARDSGQIEQDAEKIIALYRDEYYYPETTDSPGIAEMIVLKNRSGSTFTASLAWVGNRTFFGDLAHGERIVL